MAAQRIEVLADTATQQGRRLRQVRDAASESVQPQPADVVAVDGDGALVELVQPEQRADDAAFASAGAALDADFVPVAGFEGHAFEHRPWGAFVLKPHVIETDVSLLRPV